MAHQIPAPETDFLDPKTGKLSRLWYQYLHGLDVNVTKIYNTVTYGPFSPSIGNFSGGSSEGEIGETGPRGRPGKDGRDGVHKTVYLHVDEADNEPGPRGRNGRDGKDGVTRIVYVYLPADENEPMTVYRKLA